MYYYLCLLCLLPINYQNYSAEFKMEIKSEAKLVRIFIGESDKIGHIPVYEKIVLAARKSELAGATVFKGIMGFGKNSIIHTSKILRLSEDLPLIIEIAD